LQRVNNQEKINKFSGRAVLQHFGEVFAWEKFWQKTETELTVNH